MEILSFLLSPLYRTLFLFFILHIVLFFQIVAIATEKEKKTCYNKILHSTKENSLSCCRQMKYRLLRSISLLLAAV